MMLALSTAVSGSSLSELYIECMQSFGEFLLALSDRECRVIRLGQVQLSEILEEYGRTKVWGNQTNAELPARARGSLDDTLRHDDELKDLVQAILMRLRVLLNQATCIARRKYNPVLGSDHDSISSVSADSASDSDGEGERQSHRMPKVRLLVQQTLEQIRSLYDMSALLRRPTIADKYIRSVNSRLNIVTPSNAGYLPMSIGLSRFDEAHIVEKMLQWRGLTKSARRIDFEVEGVAPIGQGLKKYLIDEIMWLCQRLAVANTRRREQFQYWADHPYDPRHDTTTNEAQLATRSLAHFRTEESENNQEQESRAPTLETSIHVPRGGPKSALSKQSFSTAAVSDIYDTKTNVRLRTVYAPTVAGQGRSNSVPDPPKIEIGTTFLCPYCGTTLESSEMQNRQSWKRHVFRDLRPYVCTFEDCQNGGKLYISRHDWVHHELQIHRRNYVCKLCQKMYSSRKEMSAHLREHYDESVSPGQLGVILDLCNFQVDISEYKKYPCLFCGEELLLWALQGHLAVHMEDIALFVLPNTNGEEQVEDSKASVDVAKQNSEGKITGTESEPSSLGYSVAGDDRQIPTDFAKLLISEEEGYTSKFLSWRTDDDRESSPMKCLTETNNTNLGGNHPDTTALLVDLASACYGQVHIEAAERLHIQLEEASGVLDEDHPDPRVSIASLLWTYKSQGRWEEAERLQIQVVETVEPILGEDHPDTLASIADLALTYTNQRRWAEAEQLQVQVIKTRKELLGEDHPDTVASMADLALTYTNQGRWEEAERLQVQVVEIRKQILGEDHPDTLASMVDLALTYTNQGRWEEAERLQIRVVETRKQILGEDHPDTVASMADLAWTYTNQGRWEEAERLQVRVVETFREKLGENHPYTSRSIASLARIYIKQGRLEEAERL